MTLDPALSSLLLLLEAKKNSRLALISKNTQTQANLLLLSNCQVPSEFLQYPLSVPQYLSQKRANKAEWILLGHSWQFSRIATIPHCTLCTNPTIPNHTIPYRTIPYPDNPNRTMEHCPILVYNILLYLTKQNGSFQAIHGHFSAPTPDI